uniref:Uncharacterized protein n=1 Tax=Arundo donax TaxID=35708 RepID=A0A0A8Y540_ARUDO
MRRRNTLRGSRYDEHPLHDNFRS